MASINIQDVFLNKARAEKIPITVFLISGFQFKGMVEGFDNFTIIINSDGRQNLVYKHAISTILPAKPIDMSTTDS